MVKKIRRKMKVVRKVKGPGTGTDPDGPTEEVEEMVDGPEEDDTETTEEEDEEVGPSKVPDKGIVSISTDEDDLGLAKTVTAPKDASDTARRMKELIDAGASTGKEPEKTLFPSKPLEEKPYREPVHVTKVEVKPVKEPVKEPKPAPPPVAPKPPPPEAEVPIADMEPLEDIEKEIDEESTDEDFNKHRESMATTFDLQEKVIKEIEEELFKKEEEVRGKLEEIKKENPEGLHDILNTVKNLDQDTIKDFVTAAETLYQGQYDKLPGNNEYWDELKKKAGIDQKAAAEAEQQEPAPPAKRDKAEEYRRREKAIDIFKKSVLSSKSESLSKGLISPLKARADASKGQASHFFGPSMKPGPQDVKKRDESMTDFMRFGKADVAKTGEKDRSELEKGLAEARLKIANTEKTLADTKMELANVRANQADRLDELETRAQELSSQVSAKEKEVADLKTKLDEAKRSATKFVGQREMGAEIEKLNRSIENLNYDVRMKNDVILGMEEQIKKLETEIENHKAIASKADVSIDDKARLEQLEELKIREEEVNKFEARTKKNLDELKEIAKDNMKAEYRSKRKEMLLENMEKNIEYQKRELDKRAADFERSRHDSEVKVEMLDTREKDVIKKEEDLRLSMDKANQELENIQEERKKIKNDLMEQARMDYRLDKRQQELRLQEMKVKDLEDSVAKRETSLKARETEFKSSGGLDQGRIDEVLKMKTAELARKEEALKAKEEELESRTGPGDKDAQAVRARLRVKEEELKKLEASLKEKWAQLQVEAKRAAGGAMTAPIATGTEGTAEIKPLLKVRCVGCRELIPIYSTVRPLKVQCPKCQKVGVLK